MAASNRSSNDSTHRSNGSPKNMRCHHCAGPLSKDLETSEWTVPPFIRDSFSMIGSAVGGTTSAFYGFNHVMPVVQRSVKGPMWLHFLIGAPPVIVFSSACAGLADLTLLVSDNIVIETTAGGTVPAVAQLISSSYHAALSSPTLPPSSKDDKIHKSRTSSAL
ncbi:uncharacterized protein G2W53_021375 [Senna tora]|uniref:Uncharacterized protein n=1 Tax=Senna tora TaxID=362788 RepID=A0A834TLP0_9FABA|nr:uncharacterized protein G2W53_021375 [Senna tora]